MKTSGVTLVTGDLTLVDATTAFTSTWEHVLLGSHDVLSRELLTVRNEDHTMAQTISVAVSCIWFDQ